MSARQNRRAVYDLGSNSTRFLLVEGPAEKFKPARVIDRGMTVTRLGEGLDEEGYLKNSRVNKVVEVLGEYERRIKDSEGEWVGGDSDQRLPAGPEQIRIIQPGGEDHRSPAEVNRGPPGGRINIPGSKKSVAGGE